MCKKLVSSQLHLPQSRPWALVIHVSPVKTSPALKVASHFEEVPLKPSIANRKLRNAQRLFFPVSSNLSKLSLLLKMRSVDFQAASSNRQGGDVKNIQESNRTNIPNITDTPIDCKKAKPFNLES